MDDEDEKNEDEYLGIECTECGCRHLYVIQTYRRRDTVYRRRECRSCGKRMTTRERRVE